MSPQQYLNSTSTRLPYRIVYKICSDSKYWIHSAALRLTEASSGRRNHEAWLRRLIPLQHLPTYARLYESPLREVDQPIICGQSKTYKPCTYNLGSAQSEAPRPDGWCLRLSRQRQQVCHGITMCISAKPTPVL